VLGEPPGHCGLAGADPAREAYAQHAGILAGVTVGSVRGPRPGRAASRRGPRGPARG
jgi:hypothetical protein